MQVLVQKNGWVDSREKRCSVIRFVCMYDCGVCVVCVCVCDEGERERERGRTEWERDRETELISHEYVR